ncbi:MAG TPA: hypothetical protein VNI55_02180 [Gaiellaceae bacterium]|nr:hypothetical protein [Gaiellaceae bacterium]
MVKIALAAALIAAALHGVKSERVLERAGLFGSCSAVAGAASDAGGWMACTSGRLSGYPDLSHDSCTLGGTREQVVYWRCPDELVSSRTASAQSDAAQSP